MMKKVLTGILAAAMAVSILAGFGNDGGSKTAKVIDIALTDEQYAFGVDKTQPELMESVNAFIKEINENRSEERRVGKECL